MSSPYLSSFLPVMSQQPKDERPSYFDSMQLPHATQLIHNANVPPQRHEAENLLWGGSGESSCLNGHEPHTGCLKNPTPRKRLLYIFSPSLVAKTGQKAIAIQTHRKVPTISEEASSRHTSIPPRWWRPTPWFVSATFTSLIAFTHKTQGGAIRSQRTQKS